MAKSKSAPMPVVIAGVQFVDAGAGVHEVKIGKLHVLVSDPLKIREHDGTGWIRFNGQEIYKTDARTFQTVCRTIGAKLGELRDALKVFT